MKKIISILLLLSTLWVKGQDLHFSQFHMSPLNLNPGLVGQFNGDYRFHAGYRDQWKAVTVPYRSFSLSADARNLLKISGLNLGLVINHDKAGDSKFTTFQFNIVPGYELKLGERGSFSVGLQIGITNRNLSYSDLYFDNQYNGIQFSQELENGENFPLTSRTYLNLHTGGAYRWVKNERATFTFGYGAFNLNKPKQSYFDNTEVVLDTRHVIQFEGVFKLKEKLDLVPELWYLKQGKFQEMVYGTSVRYHFRQNRDEKIAFLLGAWMRNKDAGFISAGGEYNNWKLQISYDVNYSTLRVASNNRGAFEVQLRYIIKNWKPKFIQHRICPTYI